MLTTKQKILLALYNNRSKAEIKKEFNMSKQLLDYHIRNFVEKGLIERTTGFKFTKKGVQVVKPINLTKTNI